MGQFQLDGKTALITGASRGIGRGIAEEFASKGASVAVNHPPDEKATNEAHEVVSKIRDSGGDAIPVEADVSNVSQVETMVDTIKEEHGTIDILVNNAGISPTSKVVDMPVDMWDKTIDVNLRGVFLVTKYALPGMLDQGQGRIINIASQMAFLGDEKIVHYCASKGGVVSFTRALAREVAPDINVNAIAPGPIDTPLQETRSDEWVEQKRNEVPLGRIGTVDDVALTALFLASRGGDYYTGQVLSPDGGDAMH